MIVLITALRSLIKADPYNKENVLNNIKNLISIARENNKEVIYIRHNVNKDKDIIEDEEWDIYNEIAPNMDEKVINKKYNSAFYKTDLKKYLETKGINTIILMGIQTEYCVDTTCKVVFEY